MSTPVPLFGFFGDSSMQKSEVLRLAHERLDADTAVVCVKLWDMARDRERYEFRVVWRRDLPQYLALARPGVEVMELK